MQRYVNVFALRILTPTARHVNRTVAEGRHRDHRGAPLVFSDDGAGPQMHTLDRIFFDQVAYIELPSVYLDQEVTT